MSEIRFCTVCWNDKHTTNTEEPYVCETCKNKHFAAIKNELSLLKNRLWYKIGRVLRLI